MNEKGAVSPLVLSAAHIAAVSRPRRIIVNNDVGYGPPMEPGGSEITPDRWVADRFRLFDEPGSQVDCVSWCLDEGNYACYPSQVLPRLIYPDLQKWLDGGTDIARLMADENHERGLEAFRSASLLYAGFLVGLLPPSGVRRGATTLERYSDYANRLPRGRAYLRNGLVIDLQIASGKVQALVSGSAVYKVEVAVSPVPRERWHSLCQDCAGAIESLVELLQGRFSKGVMERICQQHTGLFPSRTGGITSPLSRSAFPFRHSTR